MDESRPTPPPWRPWHDPRARLATLAVLLGVALYVGRDRLVFGPLVRAALVRLEASTGLGIEVGELTTRGLDRITVRGLRITDGAGTLPRVDGELERLELELDPWALLARRGTAAVRRVRAARGRLFVDLEALAPDGGATPTALAELPVLDLTELTLELRLADGRALRMEGLALDTRPDPDGRRLLAAADTVALREGAADLWSGRAVELQGRVRPDALAFQELALGGLRRPFEAELGFGRGLDPRRVVVDWPLIGGNLLLEVDLATAAPRGELRLRCDRVGPSLERDLPLAALLPGFDPALAAPLAGLDGALEASGEFVFAPTLEGGLRPSVAARVERSRLRHPAWGDRALELDGRLALTDGDLELPAARGALDGARFEFTDVALPDLFATLTRPWDAADGPLARSSGSVRLTAGSDDPLWASLLPPRVLEGPAWQLELEASTRSDSLELRARDARLAFDGGRLRVSSLAVSPADGRGAAPTLAATGRLELDDLGPLAAALGLPDGARGAGGLDLTLALGDGAWTGSARATLGDVALAGLSFDGIQAGLRLERGAEGEALLRAEDLRAVRETDLLRATAELELDLAELRRSRLRALDGRLDVVDLRRWFAAAPALALGADFAGTGPLDDPRLELDLSWSPLERAPEGLASLRAGSAVARARGRTLVIERLEQSLGIAGVTANGELELPTADRSWRARLAELEVVSEDAPGGPPLLALVGEVELDAATVAGLGEPRSFELAGEAGRLTVRRAPGVWRFEAADFDSGLIPTYLVPAALRPGAIDGALELAETEQGLRLSGELRADAPRVEVAGGALVGEGLGLSIDLAPLDRPEATRGTVTLEAAGLGSVGLWPGDASLPRGAAAVRLSWEADGPRLDGASLDLPGRLQARAEGVLVVGPGPRLERLTLDGAATIESLAPLAGALADLRLAEGRLELERVRLDGPPSDLGLEARGRLLGGGLRFEGDVAPLRELWGEFEIADRRLRLIELRGEAGSAPLTLSGELGLTGDHRLDLRLRGDNALLHRSSDLLLRGDLDLAFTGPLSGALVGGRVVLRNSRFDRNLELLGIGGLQPRPARRGRGFELFSLRRPPLADLRFDVAIESAEGDPFRISTNVLRATLRPDLRLVGTGAAPGLVGSVFTDPTRLDLPAGRLRIPGGLIRFEPGAPNEPRLELRGETRLRGYDLTVAVTGPYDDPQIEISAVPPLSTEDALVLLATGQLPDAALSRRGGIQTAQMLALFVAKDLGAQVFGAAGDQESSVLDRFEADVGRDISRGGRPTIQVSFRLTDDVLIERDSLFLTGERDRYEDVNGGLRLLVRFE